MLKELCNVDNYINFLFYGPDVESSFPINERITAYRQKYNRLSRASSSITETKSTSHLLFKAFYSCLKNESYLIANINEDKLILVDNLFESSKFDRLIYNNYISISFVELILEDDNKWEEIKSNIYELLGTFKNSIQDDSKSNYRILSFDIPVLNYNFKSYEPELMNYNIDIISEYLNILDSQYELLGLDGRSLSDKDMINKFTSELKYFLNTNKVVDGGYFSFDMNERLLIDSCYLTKMYIDIIPYISQENLHLVIKLQYKIFEYIFKNYPYFKEDCVSNKLLYSFISFDIILYNKSRLITDTETLEKVFATYNYLIIRLQDILDELSYNINKKTFVFMYKNQLYKSRNKLQERMM